MASKDRHDFSFAVTYSSHNQCIPSNLFIPIVVFV